MPGPSWLPFWARTGPSFSSPDLDKHSTDWLKTIKKEIVNLVKGEIKLKLQDYIGDNS